MSQFGMQSARARRFASPDVYTALAVVACVFLAAACGVMFVAAGKVGKGGSAFSLQDAKAIDLKAEAAK